MPWSWLLALCAVFCFRAPAEAVDLKNRSTSRSGQFIVYCDDRDVRARVVSSVEEVKGDVLRILQEADDWDFPIIISIERAEAGKPVPATTVQLSSTLAGPKIDIIVRVGDDPSKVFLHRHVLRALFLEIAYRERVTIKPGERYTEPPWWLADGFFQTIRRREAGQDTDIFKSIVNTDKLPALEKFLTRPPTLLDTPAGTVDSACAMCLVEALLALPNGAQNMGRFIRRSPDAGADVLGMLGRQFPVLAGSPQNLAKWWALQVARFAHNEDWQGMNLAESEKEFAGLLTLEVAMDKKGTLQKFALADFEQFVKAPGARTALSMARVKIAALAAKASPLYRPIISEYEHICGQLSVRRTRGIAKRIAEIEQYRTALHEKMGLITDYMNWYEATQDVGNPGAFDRYLRQAREAAAPPPPPPADPKITEYLDALEKDFQPLFPDTIPGVSPKGAVIR
jgi:hypothetical protein